jgi:HK97 family phage prohead protease
MPLPIPDIYEGKEDFIDRCMVDEVMVEDFEDDKQRLAVCNAQFEDKKNINIWDKKFDNSMEKRIFNIETNIEKRDIDGESKDVIVGYGSIYNSRSENLGGFYEYIEEGAFTPDLIQRSDIRALINHDPSLILARSKNGEGTLKLQADETGLRYEFDLPDLSYAKDLGVNMANGNLNQSSFAFTVEEDDWSTDNDGNNIRTIKKIDRLFDISVVTYPAYSQAQSDLIVAQRGLQSYKDKVKKENEEKDLVKRSLVSLKIELKKRK